MNEQEIQILEQILAPRGGLRGLLQQPPPSLVSLPAAALRAPRAQPIVVDGVQLPGYQGRERPLLAHKAGGYPEEAAAAPSVEALVRATLRPWLRMLAAAWLLLARRVEGASRAADETP